MLSTVYSLVMWNQEKRPDRAEDVFQLRKCLPSINTGLSSILSTIAPTYNFNNWERGAGESAVQVTLSYTESSRPTWDICDPISRWGDIDRAKWKEDN